MARRHDLLAWLRTPGLLKQPGLADRLEAKVRQAGAHDAAEARALWESEHWKLDDLDRLRDARGGAAFLAELERQLARLFAAPYKRRAAVLRGPELDDPRVYVAAQKALAELRAVVEADPRTRLEPQRVLAVLRELRVQLGEPPQPDRVQVADPGAIRARRFAAVFVCGLQEGEFPRGRPRPSRSCPTRTGARSPPPADCACPCARTSSTASATCSTSAARARSGCSCCRRGPATRRARRRRSRSSSRTCATCSRGTLRESNAPALRRDLDGGDGAHGGGAGSARSRRWARGAASRRPAG